MSVVKFTSAPAVDALDLNGIKRRFLALNRERLRRVQESLRPRQRAFLDLLPLLFHINHPLLPGFDSKKAPAGVSDYAPTQHAIETVQRLVKSFVYKRRALRQYSIYSIFLMGSSGTVAYSEQSDFDIWICHRPDLNEAMREALTRKAEAISKWAETLELEVHFFVMDADAFRRGEHGALSRDSSGSTQHHLLLEEFYRTGLLVAGRYPIWWLVPPDAEPDYDNYVRNLLHRRFVKDNECLDFGGLNQVPAGEFFGAALWQLYKAIDSPYKSVLKILLMEAYSSEYPNVDLLSRRFKRAVYQGQTDLDRLDPYVLMSNKVEEYLLERGEHERLELARRCFYFKVGERLSTADTPRNLTRRRELMRSLTQIWGWDNTALVALDSRAHWKIHRVLEERKALVDELTRSYRMLSDFARAHAHEAPIDPADLNLLGRKLYASFERKTGKVEIINPGISTDLVESNLSLHQFGSGEQEGWVLYRGEVNEAAARRESPLKRARSLIELLAWCHFNRLIDSLTVITLYAPNSELSAWELRATVESLQQLFPDSQLADSGMELLIKAPTAQSCVLYINLGIDPMAKHTRQGMQLTSNRTDALSYGGLWENLAITFDQLLVNSWQEILSTRYTGETGLLDVLCEYLAWAPLSERVELPVPTTFSFSSTRGAAIARRIEELFRDVTQYYFNHPARDTARYVLRVEHNYYVLQPENDVPRYQRLDSYGALLRHLGAPQPEFSPVAIDRHVLGDTPLPLIFEANKADVIQVFFQVTGKTADVFVIDEKGSLFHQAVPYHTNAALLSHFQRFLDAAARRRNALAQSGPALKMDNAMEFYQIHRDERGRMRLERRNTEPYLASRGYFDVQVLGEVTEGGKTYYNMYCDGREFSYLEFGDRVFDEIVRHILERRASGEHYPIYITDIDITRSELGAEALGGLQTVHFLSYKHRIEKRLNEVMAQL